MHSNSLLESMPRKSYRTYNFCNGTPQVRPNCGRSAGRAQRFEALRPRLPALIISRAWLHLLGVRARPALLFPKLGPGADGGTAGRIGGGGVGVPSPPQLQFKFPIQLTQIQFPIPKWDPFPQYWVRAIESAQFLGAFNYDRHN
jgi:hypothetical protein